MKGNAYANGHYFHGLWKYAGISGDKSYWKKGNEALWFADQRWHMANKKHLGKAQVAQDYGGLRSSKVSETNLCPNSGGVEWEYWKDGSFKKADNGTRLLSSLDSLLTTYQGALRRSILIQRKSVNNSIHY